VADSINDKQRGLAFGVHRAGDTAGAFLGVLIAALIVWLTERGATELTRPTFQILVLVSIVRRYWQCWFWPWGQRKPASRNSRRSRC